MKRKDDNSEWKQESAIKKAKTNGETKKNGFAKKPFQNDGQKQGVKGKFQKPFDTNKFGKSKPSVSKNNGNFNNVQNNQDPNEKPDWKEIKKEKKELREKRKSKKLNEIYDVSLKAKKIGEKLKRTDCPAQEREELCMKLFKLFGGNFNKLVFAHDMSRIIQSILKYCNQKIKQSIMNEVKLSIVAMLQSKYAKNCVKKLLKYGSDEIRQQILSACSGHVVKLVSHNVASPIIDNAYKTWANEKTKLYFKQEFFGDMYKQSKDDGVKTLSDVFAKATDMKSATLSAVKINLLRVLNKNLVTSAIVQTVLVEYLALCSVEDRSELIVMLRNSIFELSQTKDGVKVAMLCIWHGTTKDRKLSLKAIKDHVKDIAISEHGHLILLAMFDSIDDTVLMKKILIPELINDLSDIVSSEYGKKVILYLVARRKLQHFHPNFIALLHEGDGNAISKKSAEIREKELLEAVIEPFLECIAKEPTVWLANGSIAMVTLAILKAGHGEKLIEAFTAIAAFLADPNSTIKDDKIEHKAVEHPGLHLMLKKLILSDKALLEKNERTFGEAIIEKLDGPTIERWIEFNRACFLLIFLLENESKLAINKFMPALRASMNSLKCKKHPAASILMKKIK